MDKTTQRQQFKQARRALAADTRSAHAQSVVQYLTTHPQWSDWHHIACYCATGAELSLSPVIAEILATEKVCYLPCIQGNDLIFKATDTQTPLQPNTYGILEPQIGSAVDIDTLDVILTPLVAFDMQGYRLGMGGGFYDRLFEKYPRPYRIGMAYACQEAAHISHEAHDARLDAVITEAGCHIMPTRAPTQKAT